ncbi:hypothetical protein [Magnetofaba australis]|uniref:hypothetical protein n=1 Tax=Magnetofaba australis TaxID=1472297 RepID=UPI000A19BB74|nr:hypothetical protein [Magnetofaba australis]
MNAWTQHLVPGLLLADEETGLTQNDVRAGRADYVTDETGALRIVLRIAAANDAEADSVAKGSQTRMGKCA